MNSESGVSPKMELESGVLNSNISSENLRADKINKIDLKKMDAMLEKHLNRLFSKSVAAKRPKEAWDVDTAKLDILYSVAKETYGTVYRGTYDGQDVAVKVLDWGEDGVTPAVKIASLRSSFWQEVTVWQKLDHPNVTKFIGASLDTSNIPLPTSYPNSIPSKTCCIVAEFLPGGTLKQYLSRNRQNKLPYEVVIKLALDLSRGLSYLHSKKIVHRDIKPDNILLDANKNLKIADFGVARIEAIDQSEMTGETGTYGYMAPEVVNGKPYNRKCDVYSFGICLSEIYSCNMPFSKLSLATVSCALINKHLRPNIPRNCPSALANIIRKCWDPKPERRPEMHEVVTMLEAIDTSKGSRMIRKDKNPLSLCFLPSGRS
ncbi:serine/threonine-protein kinase STY46-like [Vigna radiata var. radiata]|uniref:Serine/threonine-protein kinase STY46-like n=1 Tax=Vigna radiata var. radiata TaxID=3916 RepID=A0A1S3V187_VIGRR|nr:serine/threonine-protein kinase STY46-like [Vigna radiata var. radiata]